MLQLPDELRSELKRPLGELHTDSTALLTAVDSHSHKSPLITVGDVVTAHLVAAGRQPDVAVIDGRTEREPVDSEIASTLSELAGRQINVANPPATLSEGLLSALREAIEADELVTISVDGEEDLAALPAILLAPRGASVVYGQPDEGMVHVAVEPSVATTARDLLSRFDGDTETALSICDGAGDA